MVWTRESRVRRAEIGRKTKRYPTDLTEEERQQIQPVLPSVLRQGRKPRPTCAKCSTRSATWGAVAVAGGCCRSTSGHRKAIHRRDVSEADRADRVLAVPAPCAAAPVSHHPRRGADAGLRTSRAGSEPSGGILDSQSIKAPHGATRGYNAGKKVLGRKRHIAVGTDGWLLMVNLTSTDISDSAGAPTILAAIRKRWPRLKHLFADGACGRGKLMSRPPSSTLLSKSCGGSTRSQVSSSCHAASPVC